MKLYKLNSDDDELNCSSDTAESKLSDNEEGSDTLVAEDTDATVDSEAEDNNNVAENTEPNAGTSGVVGNSNTDSQPRPARAKKIPSRFKDFVMKR